MKRIENNIKINYLYQCFRNLDMSTAIWVLYLGAKGMSLVQIGLLESIYHIVSMVCEIPTGAIADLLGRKKTIFAGRLCAVISSFIMIISNHFWGFAIGFLFCAWGNNLGSGTEEALIYDSLKQVDREEEYIKINGTCHCLISGIQGIGAFVGAALAETSFALSYITGMIASLLAMGTSATFTEPENRNLHEKVDFKKHFKNSAHVVKQNKKVGFVLIFYPMIFTFTTVIYFYSQRYFSDLGFNKIAIALIFLLDSSAAVLGAFVSKQVKDEYKSITGFICGLMIMLGMALFTLGSRGVSIGMFCFISFFGALLDPISSQALNELIPSEQRATILSVQSMIFSLMMIAVFPIAGWMAQVTSIGITFKGMSIILGIGLCICYQVNKNLKKSHIVSTLSSEENRI